MLSRRQYSTVQCSTVLHCTVLGCCCPSLRPFLCSFRSLNIGRDHLDERWRLALRATRHLQMPSRRTRLSKPKRARPCEVLKEIRHPGCCTHGTSSITLCLNHSEHSCAGGPPFTPTGQPAMRVTWDMPFAMAIFRPSPARAHTQAHGAIQRVLDHDPCSACSRRMARGHSSDRH